MLETTARRRARDAFVPCMPRAARPPPRLTAPDGRGVGAAIRRGASDDRHRRRFSFPKLWHDHYGKIVAGWAAAALAALAFAFGPQAALAAFVHAMLAEYLSFIVLLFALYTVAGGILVTGNVHGTPKTNTAMLATRHADGELVGTTGAAMILIRPLLRANDERPHNVHVVVFFIFLVANIGGALTPLGDPPLFVGFLRGVDFFWTARICATETAFVAGIMLVALLSCSTHGSPGARGHIGATRDPTPPAPFRVRGLVNLALIAAIIGAIMVSANWKPGISFDVLGTQVELQDLARDLFLADLARSFRSGGRATSIAPRTASPGGRSRRWRSSSPRSSSPSSRCSRC